MPPKRKHEPKEEAEGDKPEVMPTSARRSSRTQVKSMKEVSDPESESDHEPKGKRAKVSVAKAKPVKSPARPSAKKGKAEKNNMQESDSDNDDKQSNDGENDSNSDNGSNSDDGSGSDNDSNDDNDNEDGGDDDDNNNDNDEDGDDDNDGDNNDDDASDSNRRSSRGRKAKTAAAKKASAKTAAKSSKAKKVAKKADAKKDKKDKKSDKKEKKSGSGIKEEKDIKTKVLTKFERLEESRKAFKWWEAEELPEGIHWRQLEQPGLKFAPSYIRHDVPLLYDGEPVTLNIEQEEIATFYAAIPEDGPQLGNPKTREVFQKNFFAGFAEALGAGHKIKVFEKCDFSRIREHLELQRNLKKAASDQEKSENKAEKEAIQLKFGYALIDGRLEKMGNYNMEPPGLFRGRGEHPLTGTLKTRCFSENVTLNISEDACVPRVELPGHAWNSVRHDPSVAWLATWTENVQSQNKYVALAASSSFKGKSDQEKYSTAIQLKKSIDKVRADYSAKIKSTNALERQLGVAMWVIDVLALRVGGEKGEDEADTVGCCSLRREHLSFSEEPNSLEVDLEFLGKDSMLFKQTISFGKYGDIGKEVFNCLKSFTAGKDADDKIFDNLTPPVLNKHLNSIMPGLTAKVFRTYNASVTLEKELPTPEQLSQLSVPEKVLRYNAANREVAILCNHQKTVSKAAEVAFEKMRDRLNTMKQQKDDLENWLKLVKSKKSDKIPLRESVDEAQKAQDALDAAKTLKEKAKTKEDKLSAAAEEVKAKAELQAAKLDQFKSKHMFKTVPSSEQLQSRIEKWNADIKKMEVDVQNKDENKEVSLGTSKINYMDPRITVAWCKRCEVPIEKIFARTLRDKFNWAMAVPPVWKFE